jgi:hypothetical protein
MKTTFAFAYIAALGILIYYCLPAVMIDPVYFLSRIIFYFSFPCAVLLAILIILIEHLLEYLKTSTLRPKSESLHLSHSAAV